MRRFLFSVDLEEFYTANGRADPSSTPLEELVGVYLEFLKEVRGRCTFFVVGDVARKFPQLLRNVAAAGHELACHGNRHLPIDQLTPEQVRDDLIENRKSIFEATSQNAVGFRAPLMSVTKKRSWIYPILSELGFRYSSSVIPAATPLYGWPDFGNEPKSVNGVFEIPASLQKLCGRDIPFSCGTYFRLLPWVWMKRSFRKREDIVGYFHPYDIDRKQRWSYQRELVGRPVLNHLLFVNRKTVLAKLRQIIAMGYSICTYSEFVTHSTNNVRTESHTPA